MFADCEGPLNELMDSIGVKKKPDVKAETTKRISIPKRSFDNDVKVDEKQQTKLVS